MGDGDALDGQLFQAGLGFEVFDEVGEELVELVGVFVGVVFGHGDFAGEQAMLERVVAYALFALGRAGACGVSAVGAIGLDFSFGDGFGFRHGRFSFVRVFGYVERDYL